MRELIDRIKSEGVVKGPVLQVGTFLNQLVDVSLMTRMGEEFARFFREQRPTKVLTLEASGIAPAIMTAQALGIPMATARKHEASNLSDSVYRTEVYSFTKQRSYNVVLEGFALQPEDRVLIIDDFLARGHAVLGLADLVEQAGAQVVGVGIVIEKGFETGARAVSALQCPLHSLAVIASLEDGRVTFEGDEPTACTCCNC